MAHVAGSSALADAGCIIPEIYKQKQNDIDVSRHSRFDMLCREVAAIDGRLGKDRRTENLVLRPADGAARAWLHEHGEVIASRMGEAGDEMLEVAIDAADWARFGARWPALAG